MAAVRERPRAPGDVCCWPRLMMIISCQWFLTAGMGEQGARANERKRNETGWLAVLVVFGTAITSQLLSKASAGRKRVTCEQSFFEFGLQVTTKQGPIDNSLASLSLMPESPWPVFSGLSVPAQVRRRKSDTWECGDKQEKRWIRSKACFALSIGDSA